MSSAVRAGGAGGAGDQGFYQGYLCGTLFLHGMWAGERLGHRWWRKAQQKTHRAQELGVALPSGERPRTPRVGMCARKRGGTHRRHNVGVACAQAGPNSIYQPFFPFINTCPFVKHKNHASCNTVEQFKINVWIPNKPKQWGEMLLY